MGDARASAADVDAIAKTIIAIRAAHADRQEPPTPTDLGAALVVLQAARLDMDRLKADLLAAVHEIGLEAISVGPAAVDSDQVC